ncbi:MAG TPA: molybdopterin-dependent oxidoreductase [bacterium]|nr:molybdopterin-dependent oxidoreductase [bacterium]
MSQDLHKTVDQEDRWIPTICGECYNACSILTHVVNGVVRKIEGNPDSPIGMGRLCPKGTAGIMTLYDPNRVNVPLKRTNPEKGIGVDPKWQKITWEEALATVAEKLKKVRQDNPKKLFMMATTTTVSIQRGVSVSFSAAFGTPNHSSSGGGLHCGNGAHFAAGLFHGSWSVVPDFDYCQYAVYFGSSKGHAAGHAANSNAQKAADARARGMKLVVVDPMCSFAAAKSTEWIPIRPGTDGAMALAMVNTLLNELGIYDAAYLKKHTNAPYLIGPDGYYVTDPESGKPLVWDSEAGAPKCFDATDVMDYALEGVYEVRGNRCQPAFALLKEHVKNYTAEKAEEISTIPAATIRRLAKEFAEHARIGSTILIEGKEYPFRPVAAVMFRGAQGHKNSAQTCYSIELLNQLVGCADVVGGCLGFNPVSFGHPDSGRPAFAPKPAPDGLLCPGTWLTPHRIYPPRDPAPPQTMGLKEIHPLGQSSPYVVSADQEELWTKFNLSYRPEVMLNYGSNPVMTMGNPQTVIEAIKKIPFIVSSNLFLNEFTDFADIVLPDTCYMERYDTLPNSPPILNHPAGMGDWGFAIGQPVVPRQYERWDYGEFMLELADRIGITKELNAILNVMYGLQPSYVLPPERKTTREELADLHLKSNFGEERGLSWFKEHGVITWPKKPEEVYWRTHNKCRVPVYMEFVKKTGAKVKKVLENFDVPIDLSHYEALPDWHPCPSHEVKDPEFDLYAFYYRDVLHTNSATMENAWLDEASQMNPYTYNITIHPLVGKKKGMKDGDVIWVESIYGRTAKGKVNFSEGINPEALAVAGCMGHWAQGLPKAKGKGVRFNELLELDMDHADPANMNLDLCVKVKIYRDHQGRN